MGGGGGGGGGGGEIFRAKANYKKSRTKLANFTLLSMLFLLEK